MNSLDNNNIIFEASLFPADTTYAEELTFRNLEEYLNIDSQGFRSDQYIKKAVIPSGATMIPASQFFGCSKLEEVSLPSSIRSIGEYAFADCKLLKVKEDIATLPLTRIESEAFSKCEALQLDVLPNTLVEIGSAAFEGCLSIEAIKFGKSSSLKRIGDHAFAGCRNLREVFLPDSLEYVGICVFDGCTSLRNIYAPESIRGLAGINEIRRYCPAAKIHFHRPLI